MHITVLSFLSIHAIKKISLYPNQTKENEQKPNKRQSNPALRRKKRRRKKESVGKLEHHDTAMMRLKFHYH